MKCPHCNFEREEPFKFCPMCGAKAVNEENFEDNLPQTETVTFVKRVPNGFSEKSYNERKSIRKLSRLSACAFLSLLQNTGRGSNLSINSFSKICCFIFFFGTLQSCCSTKRRAEICTPRPDDRRIYCKRLPPSFVVLFRKAGIRIKKHPPRQIGAGAFLQLIKN